MPTILGLSAITMWGCLALLAVLTKEVPAFLLLALCFAISAALLFLKRLFTRQPLFTRPTLTPMQWLSGIAGLFGFHFCYFMALKFAPAIQVSLIVYLWPLLLTLLVAPPDQKIKALLGGSLGFAGVALVILQRDSSGTADLSWDAVLPGYLLAISCALIWSLYSWSLSKSQGSSDDIGWLSVAVALLALTAHFALEEPALGQLTREELFGALLLGLGPVGGAFYLWDIGMKRGNQALLAVSSFAAPLITALTLVVAGISQWSMSVLLALILVISGGWVANRPAKRHVSECV